MIVWLIPVCVFWMLAPMYLGGTPVRVEGGGGAREVLGLVLTFVLFLVVWWAVRTGTGFAGVAGAVLLATFVALLALPALSWLGFRAFGVRLRQPPLPGSPAYDA